MNTVTGNSVMVKIIEMKIRIQPQKPKERGPSSDEERKRLKIVSLIKDMGYTPKAIVLLLLRFSKQILNGII